MRPGHPVVQLSIIQRSSRQTDDEQPCGQLLPENMASDEPYAKDHVGEEGSRPELSGQLPSGQEHDSDGRDGVKEGAFAHYVRELLLRGSCPQDNVGSLEFVEIGVSRKQRRDREKCRHQYQGDECQGDRPSAQSEHLILPGRHGSNSRPLLSEAGYQEYNLPRFKDAGNLPRMSPA